MTETVEVSAVKAVEAAAQLISRTEERRQAASLALEPKMRAKLGQFFTPVQVADFIASLVRLPVEGVIRVLDPGGGVGSLTASLVARVMREQPQLQLDVTVCEIDETLHEVLRETLQDCARTAATAGLRLRLNLQAGDFIEWASGNSLFAEVPAPFDIVVMNPPYRKLGRTSRERGLVGTSATEVSNLYTAFLAVSVNVLNQDGHLVAITPRSFANGPYFRSFRRFFLERMHLDRLHVFDSRSTVFEDSDVLQENVIFAATRRQDCLRRDPVMISASVGYSDIPKSRAVPYEEVVHPDDMESFIHIGVDDEDRELAMILAALPATMSDLAIQVSTGRVVDFRAKEHLRLDPELGTVPLIYPLHMRNGRIRWPISGAKKSNAIVSTEATAKLMFPIGNYVVVKRMSSKEERRRVVASVFDPDDIACDAVGFENHVNVFHCGGRGLSARVAKGLCLWLNSTVLDSLVRRFNGHTQINATDLCNLRYPAAEELVELGAAWGDGAWPDQDKIDGLVHEHVRACHTGIKIK